MVRKFKQLKKILCFDLDGVICNTPGNEYKKSKPIIKNIKTGVIDIFIYLIDKKLEV